MPFEFTEAQRRRLSTRLMVQAPMLDPLELRKVQAELARRIQGIAAGDLIRIEALRLLAEQGNRVAADLYLDALEHFGIDPRRIRFTMGASAHRG